MYDSWYRRAVLEFDDSLAPYHQFLIIKADRSLQVTRTASLNDQQICDWVQQNQDYLVRAMCVNSELYISQQL
jgi:hypothetical protein